MKINYTIHEVSSVIQRYLFIEDPHIVAIILSTYVANRLNSDPVWLLIIAPPSSAKTELLRALGDHPTTYFLSNLTPSTLVSGIIADKNKPEPSLLPKLNGKLVVLKDFTTILSMRSENQQEIIAQFREAYDGQYSKSFGNGKELNWKGKFGLIGACTSIYDKHYGVIGAMGERFLLYRMEGSDSIKMGFQAHQMAGHEVEMRTEIKKAVHGFIDQFTDLDNLNFEEDAGIIQMLIHLATFCAYARCPVERNYRTREIEYMPAPEGPARLVKQLTQMGRGLALVHGKLGIDFDIYTIIKKIGRDLVPSPRLKVLQYLWDAKAFDYCGVELGTRTVSNGVNLPIATVKLLLEDLMVIGLLTRTQTGENNTAQYLWKINERALTLMAHSLIFV